MSNLVPNTPLASIQWLNGSGQVSIRVYFQAADDYIYESSFNSSGGWVTPAARLPFKAAPSTPLAAIYFDPSGNLSNTQIRLYYLSESYTLEEYVYSSGWKKGATLPAANPLPTTKVTADVWGSTPDIRVYYQKTDRSLQEVVFSTHGWTSGHNITA